MRKNRITVTDTYRMHEPSRDRVHDGYFPKTIFKFENRGCDFESVKSLKSRPANFGVKYCLTRAPQRPKKKQKWRRHDAHNEHKTQPPDADGA